jgi:RHS repeat-associated protein
VRSASSRAASRASEELLGLSYHRARWLDTSTGRFTQMDEYPGNESDPASLHKYLYAGANPVNGRDPSGYFTLMDIGIAQNLGAVMRTVGAQGLRQVTQRIVTAAHVYGRVLIHQLRKCVSQPRKCKMPVAVLNTGMPIVGTSEHIDEAQGANPGIGRFTGRAPMILHRTKPHSRSWLRRTTECRRPQSGRAVGLDCDEYPFASTLEGGRRNHQLGRVSLRPLPAWESPLQGVLLGQFYRRCNIPRTTAPRGSWWADRSAFVSIAIPSLPSFFICKG